MEIIRFSLFSLVLSFDFFARKKETKESTYKLLHNLNSIKYNILLKNKSRDFDSRRCIPLLSNRSLLNRKSYTPLIYPP